MRVALPAEFRDLTLKQYMILSTTRDPIEWVAVTSDMTTKEVRALPLKLLERAQKHLEALVDMQTARHEKVLQIGSDEFGFVPDWNAFSTGEWIDMEGYVKDLNANATKIMSVLYRRITRRVGDTYEVEAYTAREDHTIFEEVSADLYMGVLLFFSTIREELLSSTRRSLEEGVDQAIRSLRNGVGTTSYTRLRAGTFLRWMKSRGFQFRSRSNTYPTFKTFIE